MKDKEPILPKSEEEKEKDKRIKVLFELEKFQTIRDARRSKGL